MMIDNKECTIVKSSDYVPDHSDIEKHITDELVKFDGIKFRDDVSIPSDANVKCWARIKFVRTLELYGTDKQSIVSEIVKHAIYKNLVGVLHEEDGREFVVVEFVKASAP